MMHTVLLLLPSRSQVLDQLSVACLMHLLSTACRPSQLGVVVTNCGYSDWSTMDFPDGVQVRLNLNQVDDRRYDGSCKVLMTSCCCSCCCC
jgi:major membrane immunogen (membrane-anchored lipoprotein)